MLNINKLKNMSEAGKVEISLNEYDKLNFSIKLLESKIQTLNVEKGSLTNEITHLQKSIEDNKDKIQIMVSAPARYENMWGDIKNGTTIVKNVIANSIEAKDILKDVTSNELTNKIKDVEKEVKKLNLELDLKESHIKKLINDLEVLRVTLRDKEQSLKLTYDIKLSSLSSEYSNRMQSLEAEYADKESKRDLQVLEKSRYYDKKEKELEDQLDELQEELEKERNNKTDRELEEKRIQEIATLNSRVADLEGEIERLKSMNIFRRTWEIFTNRLAQKEAIKELERSKEAAEKVISEKKSPFYLTFSNRW